MVTKTSHSGGSSTALRTLNGAAENGRSHDIRGPQHLFEGWAKINRRIRQAGHVVVFLDFDGTLVRLRHNPKEVFLEEPARLAIHKLVRHRHVTLCLISGRQLSDLRQRAPLKGALYFGLHGWQRSNGKTPEMPGARNLREGMKWIQEQVQDLDGIRVEDKGICFGVHYRTARKPAVAKAQALVNKVLKRLGPNFRLMSGKKIWEIYPNDMGSKGKAAKDLLRQIPGRKLVIYAGDDTTDETAFALLRNAITIRVGKFRKTKAKFFLRNPAEVVTFLEMVEEALV